MWKTLWNFQKQIVNSNTTTTLEVYVVAYGEGDPIIYVYEAIEKKVTWAERKY